MNPPSAAALGDAPAEAGPPLPLYVDLDGTLTPSDTLKESALALVRLNPLYVVLMLLWLLRGRATLKSEIARRVLPDLGSLPLRPEVLDFLRGEKARGRPLVLATAAHRSVAEVVARRLALFDDVLASDDLNLRAGAKLAAIRRHAGEGGFGYLGDSADDLVIWEASARALAVAPRPSVRRALMRMHPRAQVFEAPRSARGLGRLLRLRQWSKNLLLFLPLLAGHVTDPRRWLDVAVAFVAFGLCASASYVVNDLLDLDADRAHPYKRARPLASAQFDLGAAAALALALAAAGLCLAAWASPAGVAPMLALYLGTTLVYALYLKTVPVADVLVLGVLYAWRILTGAVAGAVVLSNWLLAFAMFLFLSLALVKRCAELARLQDSGESHARGRGYHAADLPILRTMGLASAFMSVMVLALYIDSQNGRSMYPSPQWLWGLGPLLLGWVMRVWLKVGRGELHNEDPVEFVLHDRTSWGTLVAMAGCVLAAAGAFKGW